MTSDYSRGITNVTYNLLDLPSEVKMGSKDRINYTYRSDGVKMREQSVHQYTKLVMKISASGDTTYVQRNASDTHFRAHYGNYVKETGQPDKIYNEEGYIALHGDSVSYHFFECDYLGSVRAVFDLYGNLEQTNDYNVTGIPSSRHLGNADLHKHTGKEFQGFNGLAWYDNNARYYDPILGRFTTQDPLAETTPWNSPYVHSENNALLYTDPTGLSTHVKSNPDGTYSVIGGSLDDDDLNIYLFDNGKKGNSIGITTSITSFYHSDEKKWAIGSIINPNDKSGNIFLSKMFTNTPSLDNYIKNARTKNLYDFKYSNGTNTTADDGQNMYRGMPVSIPGKNSTIYTSARDIGNIAAGYVAGVNGFSWGESRLAFDAYQSYTSKSFEIEGISTRNAESYGWNLGHKRMPLWKKVMNFLIKPPLLNLTNLLK